MPDVEDWAEIRRLHRAEGLSIKEITRRLGVARNRVRSALRCDVPPVFDRKPGRRPWTPWSQPSVSCWRNSPACRPPSSPSASAGTAP